MLNSRSREGGNQRGGADYGQEQQPRKRPTGHNTGRPTQGTGHRAWRGDETARELGLGGGLRGGGASYPRDGREVIARGTSRFL